VSKHCRRAANRCTGCPQFAASLGPALPSHIRSPTSCRHGLPLCTAARTSGAASQASCRRPQLPQLIPSVSFGEVPKPQRRPSLGMQPCMASSTASPEPSSSPLAPPEDPAALQGDAAPLLVESSSASDIFLPPPPQAAVALCDRATGGQAATAPALAPAHSQAAPAPSSAEAQQAPTRPAVLGSPAAPMPRNRPGRVHALTKQCPSFASIATASLVGTHGTASSTLGRRLLRPLPRHNESRLSMTSALTDTSSLSMTETSGIMVAPFEQANQFQHSMRAQPSFELRQSPPGSWAFKVLNGALLLLLAAAAVLDSTIN
jgi:hypothetical protein